jgi:hypothetical protein
MCIFIVVSEKTENSDIVWFFASDDCQHLLFDLSDSERQPAASFSVSDVRHSAPYPPSGTELCRPHRTYTNSTLPTRKRCSATLRSVAPLSQTSQQRQLLNCIASQSFQCTNGLSHSLIGEINATLRGHMSSPLFKQGQWQCGRTSRSGRYAAALEWLRHSLNFASTTTASQVTPLA